MEAVFIGYDYESIDVGTAAIGLTASILSPDSVAPARGIVLTVETASLRYRIDGGDPTATEGHLLDDGDIVTLYGVNNLYAFRAIRTGVVNARLCVTFLH